MGEVNVSNPEALSFDRGESLKVFVRPEQVLVTEGELENSVSAKNIKYFFKGDRYLATTAVDDVAICFYTRRRLDMAGLGLDQDLEYKIIF